MRAPSRRFPTARGLTVPSLEWPVVTLAHEGIIRWSLDGTEVSSPGQLQMRVRSGEHLLSGWDLRGRLFTTSLRVTGDMALDPEALRPEAAPRVRTGHLTNEELMTVVQRGRRNLQQCYSTALRRRPDLQPSLQIRVTVNHVGEVESARVLSSAPRLPEFERCLTNRVRAWSFPPPGGPADLQRARHVHRRSVGLPQPAQTRVSESCLHVGKPPTVRGWVPSAKELGWWCWPGQSCSRWQRSGRLHRTRS